MTDNPTVQQAWMTALPVQQQSVLLLANRGPDGMRKRHPAKQLLRYYRSFTIIAAFYGREIDVTDAGDSFMNLRGFQDDGWTNAKTAWFDHIDEMLVHPCLHFIHGAEILGYKHPSPFVRERWIGFYHEAVDAFHMQPETEAQLDARLNDRNRIQWSQA